jgi:transcriptional regulator with XRE-family HTH domain
MAQDTRGIGEALRRCRLDRHLSLATVAQQAGISVATLSRVETNKQNVDVGLLLDLARVLDVPAAEIIGGNNGDGNDAQMLSRRLAALKPSERARIFLESSRRSKAKLQTTIDDLLLTIDVLRDELINVRRAVGRQPKR